MIKASSVGSLRKHSKIIKKQTIKKPEITITNPNLEHYHFVGIGGMGMGALASIMIAKGFKVSGSDVKPNAVTEDLQKKGALIHIGHKGEHIQQQKCVVYTSAVKLDNPELVEATKKKIVLKKRAQLLAELFNHQDGVAIAGAHGKTTTSSMIGYMLLKANLDPTIMVGGITQGTQYQATVGRGKFFVSELDESDGSFLLFHPSYAVLTNIDAEHLDFYHNLENILKSYCQFVKQISPKGCMIAFGEDDSIKKILPAYLGPKITYGFKQEHDIVAQNITTQGYRTCFDLIAFGQSKGQVVLNVPGRHNVLNALACVGLGLKLKIDIQVIIESLFEFQGVQRRFQLRGVHEDIMVIDDYGHHPTEIKATLQTAKDFKCQRTVVVFQPHRYSRTKYLMDEFIEVLQGGDYLILTDVYAASEPPIEGASSEVLYDRLKKLRSKPVVLLKKENICRHLSSIVQPGDLVLFQGAGDITQLATHFLNILKSNS